VGGDTIEVADRPHLEGELKDTNGDLGSVTIAANAVRSTGAACRGVLTEGASP